jgi:predicted DsbA family dithiol-disulfide isomerase
MKRLFSVFALLISSAATLTLGSAAQAQNNALVAKVNGTTITATDFENKEAANLLQARYQLYLSERKILDHFMEKEVLELAAKKAGLTVDQLLDQEVYQKMNVKDPTQDQLEVYYEGLGIDQPFAEVHDQILDHIRDLRRTKARTAYVSKLKTQSDIRILLEPPSADVDPQGGFVRGSSDAPVTLVEFADYECPYCSKVNPMLKQIEQEYGSRLKVVYKDFPLPMHKNSEKASEAARCAGEQGKFWEYHDVLFSSHQLDIPNLKRYAGDLKLEQAKFDKCLDSSAEAEAVKKDLDEGQRLGLTGTPSFFVNGHFFSGAADSATLHEVVGMEMPPSSNNASAAVRRTSVARVSVPSK